MKKGIKILIAVGVVLAVIISTIIAVVLFTEPKPSEGLEFKSNGDGTCTWVGIGTCTDTEIVVPKKNGDEIVTSIGEKTLDRFDTDSVVKIVIPGTVKTIGERAFAGLYSLETVVMNEGVERIEYAAFGECPSLSKIEFPSTLNYIGEWAFRDCKSLTEVILPEGLTRLESFAFDNCSAVKKISIPSTLNNLKFKNHEDSWGGFQFDTTSLEEFEYAGEFYYADLDVWMNDDSEELKFYYYGSLARDISNEKYPGTFFELTDANKESVICALLGKQSLKVNGKTISMTKEKPIGIYQVDGYVSPNGFGIEEFTENEQLYVERSKYNWYEGTIETDVVSGEYVYDDESGMYSFVQKSSCEDGEIEIEKVFVNFGDFLVSLEYSRVGDNEGTYINRWTPYKEVIKAFIEEEDEVVETIEEEKIEEVIDKKEDLLAALIEAFRQEGINVSVDKVSGELAIESSFLFGGDSAEIKAEGKEYLNRFIRAYTSVIYSEKFDGFVKKTIIEGHTALLEGSTYESGLPLSQERADNVKAYCISSEIDSDTSKLAEALEAVGCSNSKPVYDSQGAVNKAASRRVSFRFIVNLE